ncbi:MAG: DbpA RNA binding domain-containing protein [Treponema sp.]|nr:DbpA RNA binding domain-containing protein [Treponema sp.]
MNSHIDMEKTQKIIALVAEKIKTDVDPWQLEEYRSLFKKEVSLFNRSKVAAYLLMLLDQGKNIRSLERDAPGRHKNQGRGGSARNDRQDRHERQDRNDSHRKKTGGHASAPSRMEDSGDPQRYPLADEDSKWLFFSIGRSRRISPREILSLINTKTAIAKEDIGAIRIFDNYSFVQVRNTESERIIEALRGYVFRGRPLAIDYARSRKGEDGAVEDDITEDSVTEEGITENGAAEAIDVTRTVDASDAAETADATEEAGTTAEEADTTEAADTND